MTRQLRLTLAKQQAEAQARLTGRRGSRRARDANNDARTTYDADYWAEQITGIVGEGLRSIALSHAYYTRDALIGASPSDIPTILDNAMGSFIVQLDGQEASYA